MNTESSPSESIERNLGAQPIVALMRQRDITAHDLVAASAEHITHKMVARACKGRRLTPHVQRKIQRAFNHATVSHCSLNELFNY